MQISVTFFETGEDETDADTDDDPLKGTSAKRQHKQGSIVRLKKLDVALYGHCPQTEPFTVVTCRHCRMVLKPQSLKAHVERHRHEKERKHDPEDAVVKIEKLSTSIVTEKFDKISVVVDKYEKVSPASVPSFEKVHNFSAAVEKGEKPESKQRARHFQRRSTPSENSNDAVHFEAPQQNAPAAHSATESSSASNSPQPKRRKRKHIEDAIETFQNNVAAPATTCRIIVEPSEIVIRDANSSPPPLAPITNEPHPSVWIVTPSPTVLIDGSFVVKPLDQDTESEIDLKDLKVLKPLVKESMADTPTLLTPSNWYPSQPRPLAINTFNMRKLNAQRYVMATQRKLIELGRNLRTEEKVVGGKVPPKTWSFIEQRGVSFIPFRTVTH